METIKVPGRMVGPIRDGLRFELGWMAEASIEAAVRPATKNHHAVRELRVCIARVLALLDLIGWVAVDSPGEIRIDPGMHRSALLMALESELDRYEARVIEARTNRHSQGRRRRLNRRVRELEEFTLTVEAADYGSTPQVAPDWLCACAGKGSHHSCSPVCLHVPRCKGKTSVS